MFAQEEIHVYTLYLLVGGFFGYLIFVSVYSIFSIKISGFYGFYKQSTDATTFLSFAYYMAKLTYPLCYTVLYAVLGTSDQLSKTCFYNTIGNLKAVPVLGYDIPSMLPILFVLLALFFLFDCAQKLVKCLGFKVYDYDLASHNEVTAEGLAILDEEEKTILDDIVEKQAKREIKRRRTSKHLHAGLLD